MKNKLTRLSIIALVGLIAVGAMILVFNPFNGSTFALSNPVSASGVHHASNVASSSPAQSSPSGLPVSSTSPTGTQQSHDHGDDGLSSRADSG